MPGGFLSDRDALDDIAGDLFVPAVVEPGGARGGVAGKELHVFERHSLDQLPDGGGKGMTAFISTVKYLNRQPSPILSRAASSQASSVREPLNFLTLLASSSAILSEPGV